MTDDIEQLVDDCRRRAVRTRPVQWLSRIPTLLELRPPLARLGHHRTHHREMYRRDEFDEGYRAETDDSRVLCRGSDYIGPMPFECAPSTMTGIGEVSQFPEWLDELIDGTSSFVAEQIDSVVGAPFIDPDVIREIIEQPNPLSGATIPRNRGCALLALDDAYSRAGHPTEPWSDFHVALRRGVDNIRESMTGTTTRVEDPDLADSTAPLPAEERARRRSRASSASCGPSATSCRDYSNR
jgi:hypothetical protein